MKSKRAIVNFYELDPKWQKEALSNLDESAEEALYLEPEEDTNPEEHVLWDLTEAMRGEGVSDGFRYNATIGISNNSAMLLNVDDNGEEAEIKFV
jgi:hypothetical protein